MATPLLAALVMVAAFDLMFAIDSIPAIFAVTRDTFVVFAANAFSLLGMVSLYFVLDRLLARFRHLNLALAAILGYVAAKMLLEDLWHPPLGVSLSVIAGSLALAILTSALAERRERRSALAADTSKGMPAPPRSNSSSISPTSSSRMSSIVSRPTTTSFEVVDQREVDAPLAAFRAAPRRGEPTRRRVRAAAPASMARAARHRRRRRATGPSRS